MCICTQLLNRTTNTILSMKNTTTQTTETNSKTFSKTCSCEVKAECTAMYHNSKELGLRTIHNPTKLEEIEFNLKTAEIDVFEHDKKFKAVVGLIQTLRDQNEFQQKLIDELRTRVNQIEGMN